MESRMESFNVGIVSKTYFYVPYWAALEHGWFAGAGLDIATTILGNTAQAGPLESGALDVVIGTPEGVLQNAAAGGTLRMIAGSTGKLSHFVIAQSKFQRIEDLRGAVVGILGQTEGTFFHVKTVMAAHGLHYPGDYAVKETGGAPPRHKALIAGTIDMGLQSVPLVYAEEELGFSNLGDVSRYVPDWQFNTVNASLTQAYARREAMVRFLRVMLQATEWMHTHRTEAATIAAREMEISQEHAARGWDYYTSNNVITRDISINMQGVDCLIETLASAGLLPAGIDRIAARYLAPEFLAEARDSPP